MVQNIDNQKVAKFSYVKENILCLTGISKIIKRTVFSLLIIVTLPLSTALADETVNQPVLPISESVVAENPTQQDTANDQSTPQEEIVSESSELLGDGLTDVTDRSKNDTTQRLEVSTGIDKAAIIAGVIATVIGFAVFALIGVLRKLNYQKENENLDEKEVL